VKRTLIIQIEIDFEDIDSEQIKKYEKTVDELLGIVCGEGTRYEVKINPPIHLIQTKEETRRTQ
jgi:hypothetical protein